MPDGAFFSLYTVAAPMYYATVSIRGRSFSFIEVADAYFCDGDAYKMRKWLVAML